MKNFLIVLKFVGTNYHGWQIQKNAITVQEIFQNSLMKIFGIIPEIKGCSRTDSGVHANMYCVSARLPELIPAKKIPIALNKFLPDDISVIDCYEVGKDFHARYSCLAKEYIYKIYNCKIRDPFLFGKVLNYWYPIDVKLIRSAAQNFVGTHDFTSFCSSDMREKKNMVRTIHKFDIKKIENIIEFVIIADGFLYNMVRIMVGTLLKINCGKIQSSNIPDIIELKDRSKSGDTVPSCGLYLNMVFYSKDLVKF